MASALMELMRPEIEKYAREHVQEYVQEYVRKNDIEHVKAMIQHGDDNEYIKFIMKMTDEEINSLREELQ